MALPSRARWRPLRRVLLNAGGVTAAVACLTALAHGGSDTAEAGRTGAPVVDAQLQMPADARVHALMHRFECRTDGFGSEQVPQSSLVRRADGRVAVVGFERGWQIFRARGAGSLVAICLRPPR